MTREEILAKSRKSGNGFPDEREQEIAVKAGNMGGAVSVVAAMVLMLINEIADGPEVIRCAVWAVYWSNQVFHYGYQAFHLKNRAYWFFSIFCGLAAAVSFLGFLKLTLGW